MQTHKKSLIHKLLILIITLMISMFVLPTFVSNISTTVYADDWDFDEGDPSVAGTRSREGGPTWARSGVIFYLVNESGNYVGVKPVAWTTLESGFVDRNGKQLSPKNIRIGSRMLVLSPDRIFTGAINLWGPPWGENGELRGAEIREWLVTTADNGHSRAANLVQEIFGTEWAIKYENKEVFLVFEAVGWNNVYIDGINTGMCLAGTSKVWPSYYFYLNYNGFTNTKGDGVINLYTHDRYQHCMILTGSPETEKMGLRPTPTRGGKQENELLMQFMSGWGMGVVWCEPDAINTYAKEAGSPGPAEDPKNNPTKVGTKNIVKGYYTLNEDTGEKTSDGVYIRKEVSRYINIMDEPEYKVVQWDVSMDEPTRPDPTNWKVPSKAWEDGTGPATIELPIYTETLYVLLEKVEAEEKESQDDWILEESEITKSVETGDKLANETINIKFPQLNWCDGHEEDPGHSEDCAKEVVDGKEVTTCTSSHKFTSYCSSWALADKTIKLITKNTNEDNLTTSRHVLAKDSNFETKHEKDPASDNRSSAGEESKDTKGYNYKFVIHRLNKDKLSLLNYEPSPDDISKIKTLGSQYSIQTLDSKTRLTRKTEEYMEKLKLILEIDFSKSADLSTRAKAEKCDIDKDVNTANNKIEYEGDVTIKTYSGVAKEPDGYINNAKISSYNAVGVTSGRMVQSGGSVTFNPFIKMTYQTLGGPKQEVYVISEWVRQIIPNDYAEISWNLRPGNLRLTSNQWSTHADAMRLKNEIGADVNSMLPGGAVYSLDMKNSDGRGVNPQIITLKTYQTIVEGKARQYSNLKGDSSTMTDAVAKEEHKAFVESAAGMLDGTLVEMWVNPNTGASAAWASGGIKVGPGANITALHNGSTTASTDTKYYLSPDADNRENAARSDLDVKVTDSNPIYHRVWSDTSGNIRYASGSSLSAVLGAPIEGGTVILTKGQDASALGGAVKAVDNRTGFVTKYVAAVERNTGNDSTAAWAPDGKWYNEAYYGIVVVEQTSQIEVKFYATDMRTTVMDPKLIPQITKKNEPMKAFMFQYKTALPSDAAISTFKGKAVYMRNADLLFQSQKCYIISQTVQDLS